MPSQLGGRACGSYFGVTNYFRLRDYNYFYWGGSVSVSFPAVPDERGINRRTLRRSGRSGLPEKQSSSCFAANHCKNLVKFPFLGLFCHEVLNGGAAAWALLLSEGLHRQPAPGCSGQDRS